MSPACFGSSLHITLSTHFGLSSYPTMHLTVPTVPTVPLYRLYLRHRGLHNPSSNTVSTSSDSIHHSNGATSMKAPIHTAPGSLSLAISTTNPAQPHFAATQQPQPPSSTMPVTAHTADDMLTPMIARAADVMSTPMTARTADDVLPPMTARTADDMLPPASDLLGHRASVSTLAAGKEVQYLSD